MALILVVEDNPDTRSAVRAILEDAGFQVMEADTGTAGVAAAAKSRPDAVILDLRLPDISGEEVLATLKTLPGTFEVPVIIVSVRARKEVSAVAHALGAASYITKPWAEGEIEAAVDAALKLKRAVPGSGTALPALKP